MVSALKYEGKTLGYRISGVYGIYDFYADSRGLLSGKINTTSDDIILQVKGDKLLAEDGSDNDIYIEDISNRIWYYELELKMEGIKVDDAINKGFSVYYGDLLSVEKEYEEKTKKTILL